MKVMKHTAIDDDVLIVQTAILEANQHESVIIVGQNVDLLTLIPALTPEERNVLLLKEEQGKIPRKVLEKFSSLTAYAPSRSQSYLHILLVAVIHLHFMGKENGNC